MQYRPHRYPTQFPLQIKTPTGVQKGVVVDVNQDGARLQGLREITRGDKLRMNVLSNPIEAIVLWVHGDKSGVSFRPKLSTHLLDTMHYRRASRHESRAVRVGRALPEMR